MGCHFLLQEIFLTQVSWTAGRFFTIWVTREAPKSYINWVSMIGSQMVTWSVPANETHTQHLGWKTSSHPAGVAKPIGRKAKRITAWHCCWLSQWPSQPQSEANLEEGRIERKKTKFLKTPFDPPGSNDAWSHFWFFSIKISILSSNRFWVEILSLKPRGASELQPAYLWSVSFRSFSRVFCLLMELLHEVWSAFSSSSFCL